MYKMDEGAEKIVETAPEMSRKRIQQKSKWKCNQKKVDRYAPKAPPNIKLPCEHYSKAYRCSSLRKEDIVKFHAAFYKTKSKLDQDNFVLKYTKAQNVQRRRPKTGTGNQKQMNIVYYCRRRNNMIPVCRKTFLHILGLKKGRVVGVINRNFKSGASASEGRGGDHKTKKFDSRRASIKKFIKTLQPLELHYCRSSIKSRQYLPSELNITKLYKMYIAQAEEPFKSTVKASYFRRIFNISFNIGFGSPRTDVCSTCLQLQEKIKYEKDAKIKSDLMIQKRVHSLRAKAFYNLLKEDKEDLLIISFDCQKNQPMPKVPDQMTYYSRQLYIYNFTIVVGHSKSQLSPENVFAYTWTEDVFPKASNEVASALFHCLNETVPKNKNISTIRLVADGCSGQNKNSSIIGMVSKYLMDYAPEHINTVEIVFPIVGHSFLPADRVFAQIEKKIKKIETIAGPESYEDVFKQHATVLHLGTDVEAEQWKEATSKILKSTSALHFSIKKCKRFFIKKNKQKTNVLVRAEESYNNKQGDFKNICKKGKSASQITPEPVSRYVKIKDAKLGDVKKLLTTHFGEKWEELSELKYFKDVLSRPQEILNEYDEEPCEMMTDPPHLIV